MRINITIPEDIVARIDSEAELRHMSRSAYIRLACDNQSAADEFLRKSPDIQQKLADLQVSLNSLAIAQK